MRPMCLLLMLLSMPCNVLSRRACRGDDAASPDGDYPHTAILYGRVVDGHNKPVKGVRVWPHSFNGKLAPIPDEVSQSKLIDEILARLSANTDENGEFSLSLRFAGDQLEVRDIQVTGRGYVQVWDTGRYRLSPEGKCRIDYALKPGEVLAGRVDRLVNGVSIWSMSDAASPFREAIRVAGGTFDQTFISEEEGAFEVYVPPGSYTVSAGGTERTGVHSGTRDILIRRSSPAINESESRAALEALWADMDRHYSYFTIKPDVDWNKLRDEYMPRVETCEHRDEFLYELVQMLHHLDDLHIWIEAGGETIGTSTRGWRPAWNASVVSQQLTGLQVFGDLARFASVRDSDFAYLEVTALQATPAEIDALLAAMGQGRDAPGFIVDIRRCFGGSEPIAQRIAQFFCGREIVYAKNKYRHGPRHHQFGEELSRTLSPAKDPYTRPVVCLISNGTMSSGESFAQMLDALPQVVTVGEHTRGSSGNPAPFTLPGLDVKVWYSRWFDMGPDGSVVERAGVVPDILIDQPPEAYQDADPIFTRAIEVLRSRLGAD